jgi:tetratricopeptide (TPR) repeat protein
MAIWVRYYYEGGNYEKAITYLEKAVHLSGIGREEDWKAPISWPCLTTTPNSRTLHYRYLTR